MGDEAIPILPASLRSRAAARNGSCAPRLWDATIRKARANSS